MGDADPTKPQEFPESSQALVGFMGNDEWDGLLAQVNESIQKMDELPDGELKTAVFGLLDGIDAIHREALRRLVRLFKEGVLEKVISDPAINTLMELYDLLPEPSEAPVASSATPVKIKFPTIPIKAVSSAPARKPRYPHWLPVLQRVDDLRSGEVRQVAVEDGSVLLCRRDDRFFAIESLCARDGSSMRGATLSGFTLTCPNHPGCHYDVRQGTRVGGTEVIACYTLKVSEDGRLLIGLDMDFTPDLPSF